MSVVAGLLVLAGSVTVTPPALEVLTPVDGSVARSARLAIVVRPSSPELEVTLNGESVAAFLHLEGHRDTAHGYLEIAPGKNLLTVSLAEEMETVRIELRPHYATVRQKDRQDFAVFHTLDREESCLPCHAVAVDEATRKPKARDDSICSSCHRDKLGMKYLHGPVGAFTCLACHREQASKSSPRYSVPKEGPELCNACHETKRDLADYRFVHGPLAVGLCRVCHDPHGSPFKLQLHDEKEELCYRCHGELRERLEETSARRHGVIEAEGCAACHDPHAAEQPFQLRQPLNGLCLDCHEKKLGALFRKRMHPVTRHPTDGVPDPSRPGKTLSCISCHDPHSSMAPKLLLASDYLELCLKCHDK